MRTIRLFLGVVFLASILLGWRPAMTNSTSQDLDGQWQVERVIDGDTIIVRRDTTTQTIRLLGVDAPETLKPGAPVGCFGPEASQFTRDTLTGSTVRLEAGEESSDIYGRRLAWVWHSGELFNQSLVHAGMAEMYRPAVPLRYEALLEHAETAARSSGRGLWGACKGSHSD